MLEKEFVPYQESLELKELGFNEPCFVKIWWLNSVHYQTKVPFKPHITMNGQDIKFEYPTPEKHPSTEFDILELQVPTFSQAFRWFREKKELHAIYTMGDDWNNFYWQIWKNDTMTKTYVCSSDYVFETYEEAELACLRKLIEIVKEKQNGK